MEDKKKKKEYVVPEAEVTEFSGDDIITLSNHAPNGFKDTGETEGWW